MALPPQVRVDQPWKERHDLKTTNATIKELLKGGTPRWVSHPHEFKNYAKECYLADKEISDDMVREYQIDDQELLTDYKARNTNIMETKQFVMKLREAGIKCFAPPSGLPQTCGLWCIVPTEHGTDVRYICYMQVPAQIEWSVLALDNHNLPAGESYRGWRTVVCQLIKKEILTEEQANEIFGRPTDSIVSRRYRKSLYDFRHRKENIEVRDGF